jgi:TonB family protein
VTTAPDAASALTPPKLVTFVDAIYPAAAKAARLQANVDLELTIDATGAVTSARVAAPVGNGFDEAALEAARRFVFEPAKRGDKAIPARIKYRYVFELAAEAAPLPTTGELEGKILSRSDNQGIAGALVTLSAEDGQPTRTAISDPSGAFHFSALPPGRFHVKLAASGLAPLAADEEVAAGELTSVTYRMEGAGKASAAATLEFGATATIEAPPREVTKRSLTGEELLRVAGTRGDPLKAIEYMPGVGRSPQAEFIIIRGSSPADSEVEFEGAPVYRLYHFGGLTSFVQPRLLDKIDLYPGNFSARFGRKMGGIIDVGVRDPKTDALHGMVDVNVVDSSFLFEGPLTKNWSFAVAAKRSYVDLFIDKLIPKDQAQITAAPVYWDYQAMLAYKPSSNDRFRAMVYGSYDDLKLILAHPADADPSIRGGVSSKTEFHRAQLAAQVQRRGRARDQLVHRTFLVRHERRARLGGPDSGVRGLPALGMARALDRSAAPPRRARRLVQLVQFQLRRSPAHPDRRRSRLFRASHRPAERLASSQLRLPSTCRLPRGHLAGRRAADPGSGRARRLPGRRRPLDVRSAVDRALPAHGDHHSQGRRRTVFSGAQRRRQLARARQSAPSAGACTALQPGRRAGPRHPTEGHSGWLLQTPQ